MSFLSDPNGTIRRRKPISQRRNDGLIRFGRDSTSQSGEDGIIQRLFELIPPQEHEFHRIPISENKDEMRRWCVDVGAWDGKHLSNTYSLLCEQASRPKSQDTLWRGVLLEADGDKFLQLKELHGPLNNICLNVTVSCDPNSTQSLSQILSHLTPDVFPNNFELIIIDVDGTDYWLMHDLLKASYRPQVICVEFNPSCPDDLIYIQPRDDNTRNGSSLSALVALASKYNYQLCETTCYNAFFVDHQLYEKYVKSDIPFEPSIETLHEVTMGTHLYQLYDGTLKISGCKKLLWHRIPILEEKIQMLRNDEDRSFPFVPGVGLDDEGKGVGYTANGEQLESKRFDENDEEIFKSISVDVSPYCNLSSSTISSQKTCSARLLDTLKRDGFALVRGTGLSKKLCEDAIRLTNEFLQEAPETVRRSCLTKDRARRGYSPQNAENFASLIGAKGPNDLVKKFRIGPEERDGENFALMQNNSWPSEDAWGHSNEFRQCINSYYEEICNAAHAIVSSICDGLNNSDQKLDTCLETTRIEKDSHTSILTLLGYKKGARHQGCKKPLVAAHTDVGVVTLLLFDGGDVASLQRLEDGNWIDVRLPSKIPEDPVFVVNIGDCLSELCDRKLPSTIHRVMPKRGNIPRNCLALFVGFKPDQTINVGGDQMVYEEWRKQKIAKAKHQMLILNND